MHGHARRPPPIVSRDEKAGWSAIQVRRRVGAEMTPQEAAAELRDRLLAVLMTAQAPTSTKELAALAPWHVHEVASNCADCHPAGQATTWRVLECHESWHLIERPRQPWDIYNHLRRLEKEGLVIRRTASGDRQAHWTAVIEHPIAVADNVKNLDEFRTAS